MLKDLSIVKKTEENIKMARISHGELVQMEVEAKNRLDNSDKCIMCGKYVPEGRMVCSSCEAEIFSLSQTKGNFRCFIEVEELKHILNNSKYYGKRAGRDFADMIAECKTYCLDKDELKSN